MSNQPPHQPRPPANPHRNLIIALAALAVALLVAVIAIVAVAVNSDDSGTDSTAAASGDRVYGPPAPADQDAPCKIRSAENLDNSLWSPARAKKLGDMQPSTVLVLDEQFPLPASHSPLADTDQRGFGGVLGSVVFNDLPHQGLTQFQDRRIGVTAQQRDNWEETAALAVINPDDGTVVAEYDAATADQAPPRFNLAKAQTMPNYYRVEAADGVEIPAAAAGTEKNMNYANQILPDAFDDERFWVLMHGSSDLYQAHLYQDMERREAGQLLGDPSRCSQ
jgi:hypothetical protein